MTNADVVVSCLFDDKSCLEVAQGDEGYLKGLSKGSVHVNVTTISPHAAEQLTKLHEQHGVHYVAGPVRTITNDSAEKDRLSRYRSGPRPS